MKAVILAGGLGNRLRPFTEVIPKPLLPIGERAILEIQIEHLKEYGIKEIILATNYKSNYIENFFGDGSRYGVKLEVSKEQKPLGTCGPLSLLRERLTEPFIVVFGDILTKLDFGKFYDFAQEKGAILTLAIKKIHTPLAFGQIEFEEDRIIAINEKPQLVNYVISGIFCMQPGVFEYIPKDAYFGMDELIREMLKKEIEIIKYEMQEYWLDIGRNEDYQMAQVFYHDNLT